VSNRSVDQEVTQPFLLLWALTRRRPGLRWQDMRELLRPASTKKLFEVIKEDGLVRPGELPFFEKQEALQESAAPSEGLPTDHGCIRSCPRGRG